MDDKWFAYVGRRLAEIERNKKNRYGGLSDKQDAVKALWCHPLIVNSNYWHQTDANASSMCFDWDPQRFPLMYIATLRHATPAMRHRVALMPYRQGRSNEFAMDNQRILVARLLMLDLDDLLLEI